MAQFISNLPVGALVQFGRYAVEAETPAEITWRIVAKSHQCTPAYPENSVTLIADKIVDLRSYDAKEQNNNDDVRGVEGNNNYSLSNIDQWLNSDGDTWYVARHGYDAPPTTANIYLYPNKDYRTSTEYNKHSGFLKHFTSDEKSLIMDTTIRVRQAIVDGDSHQDIVRKVYLPSANELGLTIDSRYAEGSKWEYMDNPIKTSTNCTNNVENYSNFMRYGGLSTGELLGNRSYWLRTCNIDYSGRVFVQNPTHDSASSVSVMSYVSYIGVRPVINIPASVLVSDTTISVDGGNAYTIVWNKAPITPSAINVPSQIHGGKHNTISWGASSDADGDTIIYELSCAYNDGEYSVLYTGDSLVYSHYSELGLTGTITYRVRAMDSKGSYSAYMTSAPVTLVNNNFPVINADSSQLGIKEEPFDMIYQVTDADGEDVTVTESIDGEILRTYKVSLNTDNLFSVTGETWLKLANGTHTLTIKAVDVQGGESSYTNYFTKDVSEFSIITNPMFSATRPSRISLTVTKDIPSGADYKVYVCNNGNDDKPTWEDATPSVESLQVHTFDNTVKTASTWAVRVKIVVKRNTGVGACYVSGIGGNFE